MKTLQETITAHFKTEHTVISEYATTIEELEDLEIYDIAHEKSDGHEDVIYTNRAHKLIQRVSMTVQGEAEQAMYNCGGCDGKSYDEIAMLIAYHIIYIETVESLMKEIDELHAVCEKYLEELKDYTDAIHQHYENTLYAEKWQTEVMITEELMTSLSNN